MPSRKNTLAERLEQITDSENELALKLKASSGEEGDMLARSDSLKKEKERLNSTSNELKQKIKDLEFKQFDLSKELQRKHQAYSSEKAE